MESSTILVTGCAGFIGSNFIKQFKEKYPDTTVIGMDDFSTGRRSVLDPAITFYEGSILDEKLLEKIFSTHKPAYIFHFAALPRVSYSVEHPRLTTEVNIVGTVALLEAAHKHGAKRFIYSSSSALYGGAKKLPTKESENPPSPKSPYAVQKYVGEPFCKVFSELFSLDTVCLRYFNVFGPGQYGDSPYSTVISAWLESVYFPDKKQAFIEGDGTQSRDFCYIDNVVAANMLAMESDKDFGGEAVNVAHGEQTTVNEVKTLIEKYTGKQLSLEHRPPRVGDVAHTNADVSMAKELLGYEPTVRFEEGLQRTIAWFETRTE
ncbi:MAG TPA: NAD-dependent epimerase/dehydratase family protein [Candidatus Limnocylindria bacterium]|nr:NAD-dependent epimerase/dehydratase family protein [Candidatus Limnocylindria bacterium]